MLYSFLELYSGESFSTSLPGSCSVLPSKPLLRRSGDADAIIQRVVFFLGWVRLSIQIRFSARVWKLLTRGQRSSVSFQGQMKMFIFYAQRLICPFSYISLFEEEFFFCSIIFLVQVWQWRILTINMATLRVKSNIINFYNFVIQIFLAKETWSLCSLAIFFGFYSHSLHSEIRFDFRWFLLVGRSFYILVLMLEMSETVLLFLYHQEVSPKRKTDYIWSFSLDCLL